MLQFEEYIVCLQRNIIAPLPGKIAHKRLQPYLPAAKDIPVLTNPFAKKSAVLILIFPINNEPHLLYIVRPDNTGVHSNQISFPGGRFEPEDITYTKTALRETFEEVGVSSEQISIIGELSSLYVAASNYVIYPIVGYTRERPTYLLNPDEVQEVIEAPIAYLHQLEVMEKPIRSGMGIVLQAPYFNLFDKILWGATAMITSEILCLSQ